MIKIENLHNLLKEKFKNINMFFDKDNDIIKLQGEKETVNRYSNPNELIKAHHWFSDIWIYIKIQIKTDGKKNIPFTSICFFQEIDNELKPLFRAEWDNYKPEEELSHPQPHWHISDIKNSLLSFNELTMTDERSEAGAYAGLLSDHINNFINIYKMHFAMAGDWFLNSNMITQCTEENQIVNWIWNLLKHVRKEIEYVK